MVNKQAVYTILKCKFNVSILKFRLDVLHYIRYV